MEQIEASDIKSGMWITQREPSSVSGDRSYMGDLLLVKAKSGRYVIVDMYEVNHYSKGGILKSGRVSIDCESWPMAILDNDYINAAFGPNGAPKG